MCTPADSDDIIILSSDDDDDHKDDRDMSCLIVEVENVKEKDCVSSPSTLEEDLVVTFSRHADVLPHARYDCPIHPFTPTELETKMPVDSNQLICDQCFCYVCDKLASLCETWCVSGICHCNSHKRSAFWSNLRNHKLLGGLTAFNLTLSEMDSHLRQAATLLQQFRQELSALYSSYMKGEALKEYGLSQENQQGFIYNYSPVFEFVSSFLNQADQQDSRAAVIMSLGAAEDFIRHFHFSGGFIFASPMANVDTAKMMLLQRVIAFVQRQMVMANFTPDFINKLQDFCKKLHFPAELKNMRNSLCVRPWNDVLLVSVMKGQNVSGVRKDKGKKDVLAEQISVILLRTELLQRQHRYRELCRYLRVVQTDDIAQFQQIQDLIPYFMCMAGDFSSALTSLFPSVNAPASRFTPDLFLFYLKVFETATAPKLTPVSKPGKLCCPGAAWESIKDAVPLKRHELVRFALRAQGCCSAVYADSRCWTSLLTIVNKPCGSLTALPMPSLQFLQEARDVVKEILLDQKGSNMQIPRSLHEVYPDQALLLLVTEALSQRILDSVLYPILPVLNTFKDNSWAFKWLCESFSSSEEHLKRFFQGIAQERENIAMHPDCTDLPPAELQKS
ncbi:uncharacterized protein zgc:112980 isoform X2 [Oreochromis aureus]|uniref:Uncharacterized protein n=1 Tax=Oreochromis aureus TaxID=47969 RepID=A0A668RHE0_OREAU|nr:uncharacterized protein zgc:112980 isoform X2 [Oreochromis aureus]